MNEKDEEYDFLEEYLEYFFDEYFFTSEEEEDGEKPRQYYKFDPNTTDELSEDINICKYIQSYGSYILNSKDLPRDKQIEYTILSEDEFKKQLLKEMATDFKSDASIVLDTRPTNDYKNLDLKITKKDMFPELQNNKYGVRDKDKELASILNDYEIGLARRKSNDDRDLYLKNNILSEYTNVVERGKNRKRTL